MPKRSLPWRLTGFPAVPMVLCALAPSTLATDVTFRLVDQHGVLIPASLFQVGAPLTNVSQEQTVSLVPGTYTLHVMPGRDGAAGSGLLERIETITVAGGAQTVELVWPTAAFTVQIEDQHGSPIPASQWVLQEGRNAFLANGTTLTLPVTSDPSIAPILGPVAAGYSLQVAPGINGRLGDNRLYFVTSPEAHTTAGTTHAIAWPTAPFRVSIVDQHGSAIPASQYGVQDGYSGWIPAANSVALPVTEDFGTRALLGPTASGYATWVAPGRDGRLGEDSLYRSEARAELPLAGAVAEAVWATAPLQVEVVDAFQAPIPASRWWLLGGRNTWLPAQTPLVLPVTDSASTPLLHGSLAGGYPILVAPGRDGVTGDDALYRVEPASELGVLGTTRELEWITVRCPLQVLDADGVPVPGSLLFVSDHPALLPMGTLVDFPITENATYPTITGTLANGYQIGIFPGDLVPSVGYFSFEVLASGAFVPADVVIGGNSYHLGCQLNRAPLADAGANVAILSTQQAATTIEGSATDPDGDWLTYLWRDGVSTLYGPAPVGAGGEAPLALAGLAPLAVGTHVLTLEVSDGELTASSSLQLDVGNSPPEVSCAGGGTYQLGLDAVTLDAALADFDGDTLLWEWTSGAVLLASGAQATPGGGGPVSLPTVSLATGAGAGELGLGTHTLSLRCDDGVNPPAECTLLVQVVDTQAPTLAPTSSTLVLWPPNHQMADVTIQANAHDGSGAPVALAASVTSSEDPLKDGSGQTIPDFTTPVIDQATGTITLQLRAERSGRGPGRTYTITITATDLAGNTSSASVVIVAPHDKRRS